MIFTPQNHASNIIRSINLTHNQQTGTLPAAQRNQTPYSRPMEKVRRNDRMMPHTKAPKVVEHEAVVSENSANRYGRRKRQYIDPARNNRNRKNKWGERSKDWRHSGWHCKCERCQADKQRDLIAERERTSKALREWREDIEADAFDTWSEGLPALRWHEQFMADGNWAEYVDDINAQAIEKAEIAIDMWNRGRAVLSDPLRFDESDWDLGPRGPRQIEFEYGS